MYKFHFTLLGIGLLVAISCSQKTTTKLTEEFTPFMANLPLEPIDMAGLSSWKNPGANWQLAQRVYGDYQKEKDLQAEPGTGVLVNLPTEEAKDNLFSTWEHGDIELELEILMPKGSNSGIYLQGRYEVQLFDSWGVETPNHSDCGGIYQRWDPTRGEGKEGFEGHPPRINASRAPHLWQTFHILFRAPRFDESGTKVSPARFEKVYHNGMLIHKEVEVWGPTRAAAFDDEAAMGPLMIQGDHGPVALRNIRFKKYGDNEISLGELSYQVYDFAGDSRPTFDTLTMIQEGKTDSFNVAQLSEQKEHYAIKISGEMTIPVAGTYLFQTLLDDGGDLFIDGTPVVQNGGEGEFDLQSGTIDLTEGTHSIELTFFQVTWRAHASIFYEGPGMELRILESIDLNANRKEPEPFVITPGATPEMIRGFVSYQDEKRTQVLSVGTPEGIHYSYDLEEGALLTAWKGGYADVREMWVGRGHSQLFKPLNATIEATAGVPLARLSEAEATWPREIPTNYQSTGYHLDSRMSPVFEFAQEGLSWEDSFEPLPQQKGLKRKIEISAINDSEGLSFRIAEASLIDRMPNGLYRIDGHYFIDAQLVEEHIRLTQSGDKDMLLVEIPTDTPSFGLQYDIIW